MRRVLRGFATGLLVGGLLGLWLGINIGKNQDLFSNPFAESPALQKAREYMEQAERKMQKATDAARDSLEQE